MLFFRARLVSHEAMSREHGASAKKMRPKGSHEAFDLPLEGARQACVALSSLRVHHLSIRFWDSFLSCMSTWMWCLNICWTQKLAQKKVWRNIHVVVGSHGWQIRHLPLVQLIHIEEPTDQYAVGGYQQSWSCAESNAQLTSSIFTYVCSCHFSRIKKWKDDGNSKPSKERTTDRGHQGPILRMYWNLSDPIPILWEEQRVKYVKELKIKDI